METFLQLQVSHSRFVWKDDDIVSPQNSPFNATRRNRHQLIEYDELRLQLQDIAESLDRMTDALLIDENQYHSQYIKIDSYDVDIDKIRHDPALSDTRLQLQQLRERPDVDAAEDAFRKGIADLGASIDDGFSGRVEGREACVVGVVCLPVQRPCRNYHERCDGDDHDQDPSLEPAILVDKMKSGVQDQKLRRSVYGPSCEDEEGVQRPNAL